MERPATVQEIRAYLATVPYAKSSWADAWALAQLSLSCVEAIVATMMLDAGSPLREAENGVLSDEIMNMKARGGCLEDAKATGKLSITLKMALSPAEQARVMRLVGHYAQPLFHPNKKFSHNGHAAMNAVRRCAAALLASRVPLGASVVEVGPDLGSWVLTGFPKTWSQATRDSYIGAKPILSSRDSVRLDWTGLLSIIARNRGNFWKEEVQDRAGKLQASFENFYVFKKIQDFDGVRREVIISTDANYDIAFSDMPVVMAAMGARTWVGVMVRAKGLNSSFRGRGVTRGKVEGLGVHYEANWAQDRIDFKHEECPAFGYSHKLSEYIQYEQNNGYVWHARDADYVYTKAPETNDEILFFTVNRVPRTPRMREVQYADHPDFGKLVVNSVWPVGDEVNGLPTKFAPVEFLIDAENFYRVLEKRRIVGHVGTLADSVCLVRSTNVRFWMNGVAVGVAERVQSKLAEATAVVIEVIATENRLKSLKEFSEVMDVYHYSFKKKGLFRKLAAALVDVRGFSGRLLATASSVWRDFRETLLDEALLNEQELSVSVRAVARHVRLDPGIGAVDAVAYGVSNESACHCGERSEVQAALALADPDQVEVLQQYLDSLGSTCVACVEELDKPDETSLSSTAVSDTTSEKEATDSTSASEVSTAPSSVSDFSEVVVEEERESWYDNHDAGGVRAGIEELVGFMTYKVRAELSEAGLDARKLFAGGPPTIGALKSSSTTRTKHAAVEFVGGVVIRQRALGYAVSAVYCPVQNKIFPVRGNREGSVMKSDVPDGWYYTCNRFRVWNYSEVTGALMAALDFGEVSPVREKYHVTAGVPGAGKTYSMMKQIADEKLTDFLVLSVTKASRDAARKYGRKFGIPKQLLKDRILTLDSYLMNHRFLTKVLCVDEVFSDHIAKVDASTILSKAQEVRLYGDARQVFWDSFCVHFPTPLSRLGKTVSRDRIKFLGVTHRNVADTCAAFIDQYPFYYPCDCCGDLSEKFKPSMTVRKIKSLAQLAFDAAQRWHTFKQEEKDDLIQAFALPEGAEVLRLKEIGGVATVHEDQGSSHDHITTVRIHTVYDKGESSVNPSLFNKINYVLTDMTRHRKSYTYVTLCDEVDEVCKRVAMSRDPERLLAVREKRGIKEIDLLDLIN